jgi:hypothetical protein
MLAVFLSYAHADDAYRRELEKHLALLKHEGIIAPWHDHRIVAGQDIDREIDRNVERADIILLLVSPDFIASRYCYEIEMTRAMQKHANRTARVIPVIVRPCDWHTAPFGRLKALPKDGKAISTSANHDEAFLGVAQAIRAVAKAIESPARGTRASTKQRRSQTPSTRIARTSQRATASTDNRFKIKRQFTDRDRDQFLEQAFESIARIFKTSLSAVAHENRHVETKFKRIDAEHFSAVAYVQGDVRSYGRVWLGGRTSFTGGIGYSSNEGGGDNSFNEALSVEDDGYTLRLKPLGMASHGSHEPMSAEQAGGYLWEVFLKPLRR